MGIFETESAKTPYYDLELEVNQISKEKFKGMLDRIKDKPEATKLPAAEVGNDFPCQHIKKCQEKSAKETYICIYKEIKENLRNKENKDKKDIQCIAMMDDIINIIAFKPMRLYCPDEAIALCPNTSSYDMYSCLVGEKSNPTIRNTCRKAITKSQAVFEGLIKIKFPVNNQTAENRPYGFGKPQPTKEGFSSPPKTGASPTKSAGPAGF